MFCKSYCTGHGFHVTSLYIHILQDKLSKELEDTHDDLRLQKERNDDLERKVKILNEQISLLKENAVQMQSEHR